MTTPIEQAAHTVLTVVVESGLDMATNLQLQGMTGLEPAQLNDAVDYLDTLGAVWPGRTFGNAPFNFGWVRPTSRGKYLYHEITKNRNEMEEHQAVSRGILPSRPVHPVGSPYGFTETDWTQVVLQKQDAA